MHAFQTRQDYFHNSVDDLESSIWVLIWEWLGFVKACGALDAEEGLSFAQLGSPSVANVALAKETFFSRAVQYKEIIRGCPSANTFVMKFLGRENAEIRDLVTRQDFHAREARAIDAFGHYFQDAKKLLESTDPSMDHEWGQLSF